MTTVVLLAGLAGAVGAGCGGHDPDPPFIVSETGTAGDDGGAEGDAGVDETGGGPSLSSHCLMEPEPNQYAYKYQCSGNVFIEIMVDGNFDGAPVLDSLALEFGPGVEGDGYANPHVMACCPEYDPSLPNCEQAHEQYCVADLIEQGCKSMESNLRDFADDAFGGSSIADAVKRAAVDKIADHVRDHQNDCIREFGRETGVGPTPPSCDADDNGVDYASLLESGSWSFDPPGLVTNVEITVVEANWTGVHPLEGPLEECLSAGDNDGILFLEIDPDPGSSILHLVSGSAALLGPSMGGSPVHGFGELGSELSGCLPGECSTLAVLVEPASRIVSLENLELHAAGPVEAATDDYAMTVDAFAVRLWDGTPAVLDDEGTTLTVPAGAAWFAASAVSGSMSGMVNATNETAIVLTKTHDGWASTAFILGHEDGLGHWKLVVAPAQWQ